MYSQIVVTGGAGFIGSNFIHHIIKKHGDSIQIVNLDKLTYAGNLENLKDVENLPNYHFVNADICDGEAVTKILDTYNPDAVVNFAAETHVDRSITDPDVFARTNVMGTLNLLNCCMAKWMDKDGNWKKEVRYLQISTDEVYGSLGETGYFTEKTPLSPRSPYSASKSSADLFCMAYHETYGMPCLVTRCSNNYGPYQFPEKLIPLMIHNAMTGKKLPIYGDGLNIRDWLHVDDHCAALDLVLDKGRVGEVYNIGGHNERTNIFIVKKIIETLSKKYSDQISEELIQYVADRKGHDRRYAIDPQKIKDELGWEPSIFFEEGIEMTIDWYLNHKEWTNRVTSGAYIEYYEKMYGSR